jgi:hypothetical protein
MTRTGKIARLPADVREELNRRLQNGEQGNALVTWLNGNPEVRARLETDFDGRPISKQNLSEWKAGGYREWLAHRDAMARAADLASSARELNATAPAMADHLATVLTARYATALAEWDGDPEGGVGRKLRVLRALCQDVVELRRGDHSAARLKIEQARLDEEREKTEEEVIAHFQQWARNPKVRQSICGGCLTEEERDRRIRQIFGLPESPATAMASQVTPPNAHGADCEPGESNLVKPNQTGEPKPN